MPDAGDVLAGKLQIALDEYNAVKTLPAQALRGFNAHAVWKGGDSRWTSGPSQAWFDKAKATGANSMRLGMKWDVVEATQGRIDSDYETGLKTTISRAKTAGLTVMLNMIHLIAPSGIQLGIPSWARSADKNALGDVEAKAQFYLDWIGKLFKDESAVVGYNINEPGGDLNRVMTFNSRWIAMIRKTDPNKTCYVNPPWGNGDPTAADPALLADKKGVVLSSHCYYMGGGVYGYEGAGGYSNTRGYNGDRADLHAWLNKRKAWADKAGIGFHVGELGVQRDATNRDLFIQHVREWLIANNIGFHWWGWFEHGGNGQLSATDPAGNVRSYIPPLFA